MPVAALVTSRPSEADVLVIGAGPAGSAAARALARVGARVVLVDQATFPRDKVCGDALLPDALAALRRLDLRSAVAKRMLPLRSMRVHVPDGSCVSLEGELGCVPRAVLDGILVRAAVAAGARLLAPARLESPLGDATGIAGGVFVLASGERVEVRARTTVLATGAAAKPLMAFGLCTRPGASAVAARRYYRVPPALAETLDFLCISYDQSICPGYGWVFPGPDGVFNVGVGYFYDSPKQPDERNLRVLFRRFLQAFPLARELAKVATPLTPLRGAPLRTALVGATLAAPGVLVVGEAAGLTYPFSGEGVGKALESGMLAADIICRHPDDDPATVAEAYRAALVAAYDTRFRAYKVAQDWLCRPWVANVLARRARASPRVHDALEGVIAERLDPRAVFSAAGLFSALFS